MGSLLQNGAHLRVSLHNPAPSGDPFRFHFQNPVSTVGTPHFLSPLRIGTLLPKAVAFDSRTMDQQLLLAIAPFRAAANSLTIIAMIALGLAVVGVYGIATYATAQRTQEIGLRMALGASRKSIIWAIARQGVFLIASGTFVGMPLAIGASFAVKKLLFEVAPLDVLTYSAALAVITSAGILATLLPAMRASRIDPMRALRVE